MKLILSHQLFPQFVAYCRRISQSKRGYRAMLGDRAHQPQRFGPCVFLLLLRSCATCVRGLMSLSGRSDLGQPNTSVERMPPSFPQLEQDQMAVHTQRNSQSLLDVEKRLRQHSPSFPKDRRSSLARPLRYHNRASQQQYSLIARKGRKTILLTLSPSNCRFVKVSGIKIVSFRDRRAVVFGLRRRAAKLRD